jgi:hypothetical protein
MSDTEKKTPFLSPRNVPLWMGLFLAAVIGVMIATPH